MRAVLTFPDLQALALEYSVVPALALGLGAGLYFEYFRRHRISPTHFVAALHRDLEKNLAARYALFVRDPRAACRDALRQNALWFNLDRAPTTALLGMEMLAEELPHYETIADWRSSLNNMAQTIRETDALYRFTYAEFLDEIAPQVPRAPFLAQQLREIAGEWSSFAEQLPSAVLPMQLERASRLLRRIAFREEHFWGIVLGDVV